VLETSDQSVPVVRLTPLAPKQEGKLPCVVYAHGNASDLGDSLRFITKLTQKFRA
jgi:acetyl esterase/lipase